MPTPHNEAMEGQIAKTVIMPGDPLRAKFIAEHFLENVSLVNDARAMYAYTGTYKGKELTVMGSGMGMPSMGIYAYELYQFYDVDEIIRIGSCGGYDPNLKLLDVVLAEHSYSETNYAYSFNGCTKHLMDSDTGLNNRLKEAAKRLNIPLACGTILTTEAFDRYFDVDQLLSRIPSDVQLMAAEMESFVLFYLAEVFKKKAACIATVVDLHHSEEQVSSDSRETALIKMIKIALDAAIQ